MTFVEVEGPFTPGSNPLIYAHVLLNEPLVADQRYCLRLGVSLADSSSYRTSQLNAFFWYGTTSRCTQNDTLWDDYAQVTFDISAVDTSGWTILEQGFVAEGGENSLTLGAFQFGSEIDPVFIGQHDLISCDMARYFVDDVRLVACNGVGIDERAAQASISLRTNAVRDELFVHSSALVAQPFAIYALDGQLLSSGMLVPGDNVLSVAMCAEGIYLFSAVGKQERFAVVR